MKFFYTVLLLYLSVCCIAQDVSSEALFFEANRLVEQGQYCEAANKFNQCYLHDMSNRFVSDQDLGFECYNAAICYSACDSVIRSVDYYTKAIAHFSKLSLDSLVLRSYFEMINLLLNNSLWSVAKTHNTAYHELASRHAVSDHLVYSLKFWLIIHLVEGNSLDLVPVVEEIYELHEKGKNLSLTNDALYFFYKSVENADSARFYLNNKIAVLAENQFENRAELLLELCSYEKKDSLYQKAVHLFDLAHDSIGKAVALNEYGVFLLEDNRWVEAKAVLLQAYELFEQMHYVEGCATSASNLGYFYKSRNDIDSALYYYSISETLLDANTLQYVVLLNNYAMTLLMKNLFSEAIEKLTKAENIALSVGANAPLSLTYNNLGGAYLRIGDDNKSLYYFQKALVEGAHTLDDNYFATLNNIAEIFKQSRKLTEAILYFEHSLNEISPEYNAQALAILLNNVGNLYLQKGDYEKAQKSLMEAFEISQKHKFISVYSSVIENLGSLFFYQKKIEDAVYYLSLAIDLKRQTKEYLSLSSSLNNLAVLYLEQKNDREAEKLLKESVAIIEGIYSVLPDDSKAAFLANQIKAYDNLILCYVRKGDVERAFYYNELRKAKLLKEQIGINSSECAVSLDNLKALSAKNCTGFFIPTTLSTQEISYLLVDSDSVRTLSLSKKQIVAKLIQNSLLRAKMLSLVDKEDIAVLKSALEGRGLSSNDENFLFSVALNAYNFLQEHTNLKDLKALNMYFAECFAFDDILSKSVFSSIVVLPDVDLAFLPFETLVLDDETYYVDKYTFSYASSAAVYSFQSNKAKNGNNNVCVIGMSNFSFYAAPPDLKPAQLTAQWRFVADNVAKNSGDVTSLYYDLGFTRFSDFTLMEKELDAVKRSYADARMFYNDLSEKKLNELSRTGELLLYSIIHFSSHGIAVPVVPSLSSILLHPSGNGDDGFLTLNEISSLFLNADLVTLSACESGLGKAYKGEGVVGLTYAFQKAGARSVVMSLWPVDEESTSVFMARFYELIGLENIPYATALARVKSEFIAGKYGKTWSSPYFWGTFVLTGGF